MLVKDLLEKYGLNLRITKPIQNIEIEGDYTTHYVEIDEGDVFHFFEDDTHQVIISETNEQMLWYLISPAKGMPAIGTAYNKYGVVIAIT